MIKQALFQMSLSPLYAQHTRKAVDRPMSLFLAFPITISPFLYEIVG